MTPLATKKFVWFFRMPYLKYISFLHNLHVFQNKQDFLNVVQRYLGIVMYTGTLPLHAWGVGSIVGNPWIASRSFHFRALKARGYEGSGTLLRGGHHPDIEGTAKRALELYYEVSTVLIKRVQQQGLLLLYLEGGIMLIERVLPRNARHSSMSLTKCWLSGYSKECST